MYIYVGDFVNVVAIVEEVNASFTRMFMFDHIGMFV